MQLLTFHDDRNGRYGRGADGRLPHNRHGLHDFQWHVHSSDHDYVWGRDLGKCDHSRNHDDLYEMSYEVES